MSAYPQTLAALDRWVLFRGRIVPLLLVSSFVSILFSGSQTVLHGGYLAAMLRDPAGHRAAAIALLAHLLLAALLMLVHATYLVVMSHHLVYRNPATDISRVALPVYPLIALAYATYAVHSYVEATGDSGSVFSRPVPTYAAFLLAYVVLAAHGIHHMSPGQGERTRAHYRSLWMAVTDVVMAVFFVCALAGSLTSMGESGHGASEPAARVESAVGVMAPFQTALSRQGSLKDALIGVALTLFVAARWAAGKQRQKKFPAANMDMLAGQQVDLGSVQWQDLQRALPLENVSWLDLGARRNRAVVLELLEQLFPSGGLVRVVCAEPDEMARTRAEQALTPLVSWGVTVACVVSTAREWAALQKAKQCKVVSLCHVCYDTRTARAALEFLNQCEDGTLLLVRFTSDASYYRILSTTLASAPLSPYVTHAVHRFLLNELRSRNWGELYTGILRQTHDIATAGARSNLVNWFDAAYGEAAAKVIGSYVEGMHASGVDRLETSDRLVLLGKPAPKPVPPVPAPAPAVPAGT
ncbi:MAG: hypothetical protein ACRD26_04545 [Vicinamibacterales bacterium]